MANEMTEQDAKTILARLGPRSGVTLGALHSSRADEWRVLLASAASCFEPGVGYAERDVNDRLRAWLSTTGTMLATDHVDIRRWLVDTGLIVRDGYGRRYERPALPPAAFGGALSALAAVNAASVVAGSRAEDAARRSARRAAYESRVRDRQ